MNSLTEQVIVDIIKNQLSLDDERVYLGNQNLKLKADKDLWIVVSVINVTPFSNKSSTYEEVIPPATLPTYFERQEVSVKEDIQIDIISRSTDALFQRYAVLSALQSIYAQQKQELNNFKIARIPTGFTNTSGAEGGSNINRFSITISTLAWFRKDTALTGYDYYGTFTQRVDDEQTIGTANGIFSFQIDSTGIT